MGVACVAGAAAAQRAHPMPPHWTHAWPMTFVPHAGAGLYAVVYTGRYVVYGTRRICHDQLVHGRMHVTGQPVAGSALVTGRNTVNGTRTIRVR